MEPSLHHGRASWLIKTDFTVCREPKRGPMWMSSVVSKPRRFIKRIVGLPGDEISIPQWLPLPINGQWAHEPFYQKDHLWSLQFAVFGPVVRKKATLS